MKQDYVSGSERETVSIARSFAADLGPGDIVALFGDLGTGKTQFVKGVCAAFGVSTHITSPTFIILNRYEGRDQAGEELLLYHFDLYRVKSPEEMYDLGYEEFLYSTGVSVIEWADRLGELLPQRRHEVYLSFGSRENERRIRIEPAAGREDVGARSERRSVKT